VRRPLGDQFKAFRVLIQAPRHKNLRLWRLATGVMQHCQRQRGTWLQGFLACAIGVVRGCLSGCSSVSVDLAQSRYKNSKIKEVQPFEIRKLGIRN
jgi:hypothetical protein